MFQVLLVLTGLLIGYCRVLPDNRGLGQVRYGEAGFYLTRHAGDGVDLPTSDRVFYLPHPSTFIGVPSSRVHELLKHKVPSKTKIRSENHEEKEHRGSIRQGLNLQSPQYSDIQRKYKKSIDQHTSGSVQEFFYLPPPDGSRSDAPIGGPATATTVPRPYTVLRPPWQGQASLQQENEAGQAPPTAPAFVSYQWNSEKDRWQSDHPEVNKELSNTNYEHGLQPRIIPNFGMIDDNSGFENDNDILNNFPLEDSLEQVNLPTTLPSDGESKNLPKGSYHNFRSKLESSETLSSHGSPRSILTHQSNAKLINSVLPRDQFGHVIPPIPNKLSPPPLQMGGWRPMSFNASEGKLYGLAPHYSSQTESNFILQEQNTAKDFANEMKHSGTIDIQGQRRGNTHNIGSQKQNEIIYHVQKVDVQSYNDPKYKPLYQNIPAFSHKDQTTPTTVEPGIDTYRTWFPTSRPEATTDSGKIVDTLESEVIESIGHGSSQKEESNRFVTGNDDKIWFDGKLMSIAELMANMDFSDEVHYKRLRSLGFLQLADRLHDNKGSRQTMKEIMNIAHTGSSGSTDLPTTIDKDNITDSLSNNNEGISMEQTDRDTSRLEYKIIHPTRKENMQSKQSEYGSSSRLSRFRNRYRNTNSNSRESKRLDDEVSRQKIGSRPRESSLLDGEQPSGNQNNQQYHENSNSRIENVEENPDQSVLFAISDKPFQPSNTYLTPTITHNTNILNQSTKQINAGDVTEFVNEAEEAESADVSVVRATSVDSASDSVITDEDSTVTPAVIIYSNDVSNTEYLHRSTDTHLLPSSDKHHTGRATYNLRESRVETDSEKLSAPEQTITTVDNFHLNLEDHTEKFHRVGERFNTETTEPVFSESTIKLHPKTQTYTETQANTTGTTEETDNIVEEQIEMVTVYEVGIDSESVTHGNRKPSTDTERKTAESNAERNEAESFPEYLVNEETEKYENDEAENVPEQLDFDRSKVYSSEVTYSIKDEYPNETNETMSNFNDDVSKEEISSAEMDVRMPTDSPADLFTLDFISQAASDSDKQSVHKNIEKHVQDKEREFDYNRRTRTPIIRKVKRVRATLPMIRPRQVTTPP